MTTEEFIITLFCLVDDRMGQTAKHDVGHVLQLVLDCRIERGMIVAMDRGPPACHAVYEPASILKLDMNTLRTTHRVRGQRIGHGAVWMPDMLAFEALPVRHQSGGGAVGCVRVMHRGLYSNGFDGICRSG